MLIVVDNRSRIWVVCLRAKICKITQIKEPRSPICLFLFGSCFLNEKWLFETLKEDVNHLQIVSGQEYIDLMRGWKRITRTHMTPLAKNNLAAPDIRLGDRGSLRGLCTLKWSRNTFLLLLSTKMDKFS